MHDVIVVGAGPAGLNAALILGRALRDVLVLDAGEPRNARATEMHGLISRDGIPPEEFRRLARADLAAYRTVSLCDQGVTWAALTEDGSAVEVGLGDGTVRRAGVLLLAVGRCDQLPDVPGVAELWGRGVYGCPYCHGFEVRGLPLAVIGAETSAAHLALQLTRFSDDVVLCTNGTPEIDEESGFALKVCEVPVRTEEIAEVISAEGRLEGIRFTDGTVLDRAAVFVKPPLGPHGGLAEELGCEMTDDGSVRVDEGGHTSVQRVYAAGEAARIDGFSSPWLHVVTSAAAGTLAALSIDHDLIETQVRSRVMEAMGAMGIPLPGADQEEAGQQATDA